MHERKSQRYEWIVLPLTLYSIDSNINVDFLPHIENNLITLEICLVNKSKICLINELSLHTHTHTHTHTHIYIYIVECRPMIKTVF